MTPAKLAIIVAQHLSTVERPRLVRFHRDAAVPGGVRAVDQEQAGPGVWRLYRVPVNGHDYAMGWTEFSMATVVMDRVTMELAAVYDDKAEPILETVIDYFNGAAQHQWPAILEDWLDWCAPDDVQGFEGRFANLDAALAAQEQTYADTGGPEPLMLSASAAWIAHKTSPRRRGIPWEGWEPEPKPDGFALSIDHGVEP